MNKKGKPFNDSLFVHWWMGVFKTVDTRGQMYFPPSLARTVFVEDWLAQYGAEPTDLEMCEGIAISMGSSTSQWRAGHYNPNRRQRLVTSAVAATAERMQHRFNLNQ